MLELYFCGRDARAVDPQLMWHGMRGVACTMRARTRPGKKCASMLIVLYSCGPTAPLFRCSHTISICSSCCLSAGSRGQTRPDRGRLQTHPFLDAANFSPASTAPVSAVLG